MQGIIEGYQRLLAAEAEVIQVAPNLLEAARSFFRPAPVPYPVVCDPDKRLYAVYGLGDRGALVATPTRLVSFARAFTTGDGGPQIRGAWLDVRRLHHHAMTAVEQGLSMVDKAGVIRHRTVVGPVDTIPGGAKLAGLVTTHCDHGRSAT